MLFRSTCDSPDAENLRNGYDRPIGEEDNGVSVPMGSAIVYTFAQPSEVRQVRLILDSDINRDTLPKTEAKRERNMLHNRPLNWPDTYVPTTLLKAFRIEGITLDGTTVTLHTESNNHRRLILIPTTGTYTTIRLIPVASWGCDKARLFAFDVK